MELIKAQRIADRIVEILSPFSQKIHIAGSIRREKQDVKDIEIVVLPNCYKTGLFDDIRFVDMQFLQAAATFIDVIERGDLDGRYCRIKLKNTDIKCDMFLPVPEDYYRQLCIRTGSAEFVTEFIANKWGIMGYCGTGETGLRKISDCEAVKNSDGSTTWKLLNIQGETASGWESEEDFFDWLGYAWCDPRFRDVRIFGRDFIKRKLQ